VITVGNLLFRYRNVLFPALFVLAWLVAKPQLAFGTTAGDAWGDLLGLLVALAGQGLRVVTIGFDYIRRGGRDHRIYADRLVQGGVFAHLRNPLYLGNILIFIGIAIMVNAQILYWVGIPLVLFAYAAIIAAEENYLRGKFGPDYNDYCRRVNRLWPNLRGFSTSIQDMEFSWRRVIVKEYNTTFAWVTVAILLKMWVLSTVVADATAASVASYAWLLLPMAVLYAVTRRYKKASRTAA
jgi:protein-S-isoprenylcysteine O-methyltransferase Ste14